MLLAEGEGCATWSIEDEGNVSSSIGGEVCTSSIECEDSISSSTQVEGCVWSSAKEEICIVSSVEGNICISENASNFSTSWLSISKHKSCFWSVGEDTESVLESELSVFTDLLLISSSSSMSISFSGKLSSATVGSSEIKFSSSLVDRLRMIVLSSSTT